MYQKEIIYMGLFHNEIKERNAGYLKVDKREDTYRLELQVKNLPGAIAGSFPIRLQSQTGWQEADVLVVKDGNGKWNGSTAEQVLRAEVIVSEANRIKGESRQAKAENVTEEKSKETEERAAETKRTGEGWLKREITKERETQKELTEERAAQKELTEERGAKREPPEERGAKRELTEESDAKRELAEERDVQKKITEESVVKEKIMEERGMETEKERRGKEKAAEVNIIGAVKLREHGEKKALIKAERTPVKRLEHIPLYENKWEQLLTTYEQIHPYGDNRIYVKLEPKDFIVLRENYQHLVNNSFLLHGFYNYRYLILGKEKEKERGFYLGVPGVFYEREKMVALMFGFEAFECEGGEAEEGKFGYYLRKVEL